MGFLLDTCLVSDLWKPRPNPGVVAWLEAAFEEELHLSALTFGEIRKGIDKLADGRRKERLEHDYALLRSRFSGRILPVTDVVAERWGTLAAAAARGGRDLHPIDGLLSATALCAGLVLVTRNVMDFAPTPVPLVNPWT